MRLTTVSLEKLLPSKDNPRRQVDKTQIAGLAKSIQTDGVLQNLIVCPEGDDQFRVIAGKRRYMALQHLKKGRVIDGTYAVPVEIMDELDDQTLVRLGTVENVQREQLHPMDESDAFARLLQLGGTVESITDTTGLSASTVKRRLALASLTPELKKAFRSGLFNRSVAEALTLGSREQQRSVLESLQTEEPLDAEDIRGVFLRQKPSLSIAIFHIEQYQGSLTTDLFADEETTYFDDVDQFLTLQSAAVDAMAEERRETAAWVDVVRQYSAPWWHYRVAEADEPSGVVINMHPTGVVETRDGLARHNVEPVVSRETQLSPISPRPPCAATIRMVLSGDLDGDCRG